MIYLYKYINTIRKVMRVKGETPLWDSKQPASSKLVNSV